MEFDYIPSPEEQLTSPEQEIAFLKKQIEEKEKILKERGHETLSAEDAVEKIRREIIDSYGRKDPVEVVSPDYHLPHHEQNAIVLELSPEPHDKIIEELLSILLEKGIYNTISIIRKMNNPHIEDDFHRVLVEYLKKGFPIQSLKEKTPLARSLKMTLFEVTLPTDRTAEQSRPLRELLSSMEQFYSGMKSLSQSKDSQGYFAIEIAVPLHSQEISFFIAVPDEIKSLFEKQILSVFTNAKIRQTRDDYNIFNPDGATAGSYACLKEKALFPIKTYDEFDYDPLNIILKSLSKVAGGTEGAAIQIVINPDTGKMQEKYKQALFDLEKGASIKETLDIPETATGEFLKATKIFFKQAATTKEEDEKKKQHNDKDRREAIVTAIKKKLETPLTFSNLRIVTSAETKQRAEDLLRDITSTFNQFEKPVSNHIVFQKIKDGNILDFINQFAFRLFSKDQSSALSIKELTSLIHLPGTTINSSELKISRAKTAPAPTEIPTEGILLGTNIHQGSEILIHTTKEDRVRHFYIIGQTGTGKTNLIKNMILQDIRNGDGVCMIDPHGTDIEEVISKIPPERVDDVVYFDPGYTTRPMGLNMLEYDTRFPAQKSLVADEMLLIFNKLFDMKTAGGPMFEQYFRNSVLLALEDAREPATLIDITRILSNKSFRDDKLSRCNNPIVIQFWKEVAEKVQGQGSLKDMVPYITSKFDIFLSNDIMRPVIAQRKSAFNFRQIMDERKILLVNLSKGRLGEINSNLIGLIFVGKILMAALSRADTMGAVFNDFYLYIDEFQNVSTPSIATILSEARKYRLSLNIAHQYIAQLDESIKKAVFGNVGSMAVFRVGSEDADFLKTQFAPVFDEQDIIRLDNYNAYLKLLIKGEPARPFNMVTMKPEKGDPNLGSLIKNLSYEKYGINRSIVEEEIARQFRDMAAPVAPPPPPPPPTPRH